ncbi:hypothetical protein CBOM_04939 [Ceraceosorus bombacis]|uniref:Uncharacterized protein n=1 Tax=Ceraceosorus bombacis TaxID=401625 RepID=A0A0P1BH98_9BASI|nr:hypothetical protein CBOM_04939 [Ceraceosorus bombacis]
MPPLDGGHSQEQHGTWFAAERRALVKSVGFLAAIARWILWILFPGSFLLIPWIILISAYGPTSYPRIIALVAFLVHAFILFDLHEHGYIGVEGIDDAGFAFTIFTYYEAAIFAVFLLFRLLMVKRADGGGTESSTERAKTT